MTKGKKALLIGTLCITAYIINYYLRNMLSVFTPNLIADTVFTEESIALLSSTYMLFYAAGQFINGFIGDVVAPIKMIFSGMFIAAMMTLLFPILNNFALEILCFAILGFALSMMRGPLMRIITSNTEPKHSRLICVFFSAASFAGPLIAGVFAILFEFKMAYIIAGTIAIAAAFLVTFIFKVTEKKNIIKKVEKSGTKISFKSIISVFKIEKFFFFLVTGCLVEIASTSITFWIPTYLSNHLGYGEATTTVIFTLISVLRAFMPMLTLIVFNLTKERDIAMIRVLSSLLSAAFIISIFISNSEISVVLLIIALLSNSCISAILWSIYIPGLGKTGKVSSVNGILDGVGYIAAALANLLFASVMSNIGWNEVLILWASIGVIGIMSTFFVRQRNRDDNLDISNPTSSDITT